MFKGMRREPSVESKGKAGPAHEPGRCARRCGVASHARNVAERVAQGASVSCGATACASSKHLSLAGTCSPTGQENQTPEPGSRCTFDSHGIERPRARAIRTSMGVRMGAMVRVQASNASPSPEPSHCAGFVISGALLGKSSYIHRYIGAARRKKARVIRAFETALSR